LVASTATGAYSGVKFLSNINKVAKPAAAFQLNSFHQNACGLSEVAQNNIRMLREWAKSKGWEKLPNPHGGPEIWGTNINGKFNWMLKIKPEGSFRPNLMTKSHMPRFDARVNTSQKKFQNSESYINPFTNEVGTHEIGRHVLLEEIYW
jgi:hypothetical protein